MVFQMEPFIFRSADGTTGQHRCGKRAPLYGESSVIGIDIIDPQGKVLTEVLLYPAS